MYEINQLKSAIKKCQICASSFSHSPNPVFGFNQQSRIIIIGQAPGSKVHRSGIPWQDKSGENLRSWMDVSEEQFYDESNFAILPMGFCYPGKGKSGDLPPRKECAPQWHSEIFSHLENIQLTLLIGQYAQKYYLKDKVGKNLTASVQNFRNYLPQYFVLPHPSPRNNIWQKKNPWFSNEVIPELQLLVNKILS